MATETWIGPHGEVTAATTADGGTALSTTAAFFGLPANTKTITVTPWNFSGAAVAKWLACPWLTILKTTDIGVSFTDYSYAAQDADAATSVDLSSLDTVANGDALYIGSHLPFAGIHVDVDAANGSASNLAVTFWNGNTLTDISPTDNTDTGAALAIDGTITWAVPATWTKETLRRIAGLGTNVPITNAPANFAQATRNPLDEKLYWTRFATNAAFDSSTTLDHVIAISRQAKYMEQLSGQPFEMAVNVGPGGIGGIQAITNAGTASLIVNCLTRGTDGRFA